MTSYVLIAAVESNKLYRTDSQCFGIEDIPLVFNIQPYMTVPNRREILPANINIAAPMTDSYGYPGYRKGGTF